MAHDGLGSPRHGEGYGYGYGFNWWWVVVIVVVIIIILLICWWVWASDNNSNNGGAVSGDYETSLDGEQEVPSVRTRACGTGKFTLSGNKNNATLHYEISVSRLRSRVLPSHFHLGETGTNGPVVKTLDEPEDLGHGEYLFVGEWTSSDSEPLTPALIDSLNNNDLYINVHTAHYPDGEVRGQVYRQ